MRIFRSGQVSEILVQANLSQSIGQDVLSWRQVLLALISDYLVHGLVLECLIVLEGICIKIVNVVEEEHAAALVALICLL